MTIASITIKSRRVTASAEIRHIVSVSMPQPRNVVAAQVSARRGPQGRDGPPGIQGPPGDLEDGAILDGGNF
jgi:hypothetical protein